MVNDIESQLERFCMIESIMFSLEIYIKENMSQKTNQFTSVLRLGSGGGGVMQYFIYQHPFSPQF